MISTIAIALNGNDPISRNEETSCKPDYLKTYIASSAMAAALVLPAGVAMAQNNPSSQPVLKAMKPKAPLTRSLSVSPADPGQEGGDRWGRQHFAQYGRPARCRALTRENRERRESRPRIDAQVIDFNSSTSPKSALRSADELQQGADQPGLARQHVRIGRLRMPMAAKIQPLIFQPSRRRGEAVSGAEVQFVGRST